MFDRKTAKICQSENIFYICSRKTKRKGFRESNRKKEEAQGEKERIIVLTWAD